MRKRDKKTANMLIQIIRTPKRQWIEFPVAPGDTPTKMQHRIRVLLSRIRDKLRSQGKPYDDFTLVCRTNEREEEWGPQQYVRFIRVDNLADMAKLEQKQELATLEAMLEKTDVKEILDDV